MNIAIDMDGTADALPIPAMRIIVESLRLSGCNVYLVTSRHDRDKDVAIEFSESIGIPRQFVVCTNGIAKKYYCLDLRGVRIDIWFDDDPASIVNGK